MREATLVWGICLGQAAAMLVAAEGPDNVVPSDQDAAITTSAIAEAQVTETEVVLSGWPITEPITLSPPKPTPIDPTCDEAKHSVSAISKSVSAALPMVTEWINNPTHDQAGPAIEAIEPIIAPLAELVVNLPDSDLNLDCQNLPAPPEPPTLAVSANKLLCFLLDILSGIRKGCDAQEDSDLGPIVDEVQADFDKANEEVQAIISTVSPPVEDIPPEQEKHQPGAGEDQTDGAGTPDQPSGDEDGGEHGSGGKASQSAGDVSPSEPPAAVETDKPQPTAESGHPAESDAPLDDVVPPIGSGAEPDEAPESSPTGSQELPGESGISTAPSGSYSRPEPTPSNHEASLTDGNPSSVSHESPTDTEAPVADEELSIQPEESPSQHEAASNGPEMLPTDGEVSPVNPKSSIHPVASATGTDASNDPKASDPVASATDTGSSNKPGVSPTGREASDLGLSVTDSEEAPTVVDSSPGHSATPKGSLTDPALSTNRDVSPTHANESTHLEASPADDHSSAAPGAPTEDAEPSTKSE